MAALPHPGQHRADFRGRHGLAELQKDEHPALRQPLGQQLPALAGHRPPLGFQPLLEQERGILQGLAAEPHLDLLRDAPERMAAHPGDDEPGGEDEGQEPEQDAGGRLHGRSPKALGQASQRPSKTSRVGGSSL